ncbi:hypothetical protein FS749_012911 [Ceratobasidium sp. UAMH 11750]|nr:hypothetical protein FS749_012911 [Ceratobasidium sp. UAMH 11750]
MESPRARIVATPELIRSICQFSDPFDHFDLLCVSQSFFKAAVPLVWEEIQGVEKLLTLIPGIRCSPTEKNPKIQKISVSQEHLDFERFNLYAPHVQKLDIYSENTEKYTVPKWPWLMVYARERTLLPNLVTLTLKPPKSPGRQIMMWIPAFLSPTLTEISVIPSDTNQDTLVSHLEGSGLFRRISIACPNLKKLSLCLDGEGEVDYQNKPNNGRTLAEFWDNSLPQYLARMESLCELCTTTEVLVPNTITHLAGLPNLKSLAIYPTTRPFVSTKVTQGGLFPVLRKFSLKQAPHALFPEIWQLQIFRNLTSLVLTFLTQPETDDEIDLWCGTLMSLISESSPNLVDLSVDFDSNSSCHYYVDISLDLVTSSMEKLPLQQLELRSASLCGNWEIMPKIWSQLTVLKLHEENVTAAELIWFAKLVNLEHLTVGLSLSTPLPSLVSFPPEGVNMYFITLQSSGPVAIVGDIHEIARWLLSLWPTLKRVDWGSKAQGGPINESGGKSESFQHASTTMATGLNSVINLIRELSEAKLRLSKAYGNEALKLFPKNL